jgi:hypothetical protein
MGALCSVEVLRKELRGVLRLWALEAGIRSLMRLAASRVAEGRGVGTWFRAWRRAVDEMGHAMREVSRLAKRGEQGWKRLGMRRWRAAAAAAARARGQALRHRALVDSMMTCRCMDAWRRRIRATSRCARAERLRLHRLMRGCIWSWRGAVQREKEVLSIKSALDALRGNAEDLALRVQEKVGSPLFILQHSFSSRRVFSFLYSLCHVSSVICLPFL